MKLSKTEERKLATKIKHIVGECSCAASSKTCAYWKNIDKNKPLWQTNLIIKEVNNTIKRLK